MYVTRPLSLYKNSPEALAQLPPRGPNSGYLVLQDEESTSTTCFGLCKNKLTTDLPFPQNKRLTIEYSTGESSTNYRLFLIPVINQPLSSNQYYAIKGQGKHRGESYTSSTEEDRQKCCFCINYIRDQKTRPLDPNDRYQQFEFSHGTYCASTIFRVNSVAPEAYPPTFMRQKGWRLWNSTPKYFTLGVADGLNSDLRARLPEFSFPLSQEDSRVQVVGKWYTPFMFVKEATLKQQMLRSMFYEVILEQKWTRIFYRENNSGDGNFVSFDVPVPTRRVTIGGKEAAEIRNVEVDGMMWFRTMDDNEAEKTIGLSSLIVERMIWEQESFGWSNTKEKVVNVARVEEYGKTGSWGKFACYMLVERFLFKRMDGCVTLTYDFNHTHQVKIKWDGTPQKY